MLILDSTAEYAIPRLATAARLPTLRKKKIWFLDNQGQHWFGPRTAEFVHKAGYTKEKVRRFLWENARHRLGDLEKNGFWAPEGDARNGFWAKYSPWLDQTDRNTMVPVVESEQSIHIIVTGGGVLPVNAICNGWGCLGGYAVTKPIG